MGQLVPNRRIEPTTLYYRAGMESWHRGRGWRAAVDDSQRCAENYSDPAGNAVNSHTSASEVKVFREHGSTARAASRG